MRGPIPHSSEGNLSRRAQRTGAENSRCRSKPPPLPSPLSLPPSGGKVRMGVPLSPSCVLANAGTHPLPLSRAQPPISRQRGQGTQPASPSVSSRMRGPTHPSFPRRASPRDNGDRNPSRLPFRVLAIADRQCGDPSPSLSRAEPARQRGQEAIPPSPLRVLATMQATSHAGTGTHPSNPPLHPRPPSPLPFPLLGVHNHPSK